MTGRRLPKIQESQKELAAIHDFGSKLLQPSVIDLLKAYTSWQTALRRASNTSEHQRWEPDRAPLSINLDLTTACNYACDHCVDKEILNIEIRYDHGRLLDSLALMIDKGLRSVILIGGGEPTLYPRFEEVVQFLKARDVNVAIVTNGTGMKRIGRVAHLLDRHDWVRLSIDAGKESTFRAIHNPRNDRITLDSVCRDTAEVKQAHPGLCIGYSFVVTWRGAFCNGTSIVENIDEIEAAARRAKSYLFDYISLKPFLLRSPDNNAEIVGVDQSGDHFEEIMVRLAAGLASAGKHESDTFKVVESTNLHIFQYCRHDAYSHQPHTCHMQFFRQVLSPLGLFNCPVYRHVNKARIGDRNAYATEERFERTKRETGRLIQDFDASRECREVTCLYNPVNWMIEKLIEHPEKWDTLPALKERRDYFL